MRILACDTSNRACSCCLWEEGRSIDTRFRNDGLTHSQTFMPQVHDLMEKNNAEYSDLDALACTVGPGSFTGIRIGVSAVKTMAMALEKPAVPVSSLAAMAYPLHEEDALVVPLIDCRNHRAWAAAYYRGQQVLPEMADDVNEIRTACLDLVAKELSNRRILLIGSGAPLFLEEEAPDAQYKEGFDEILPESVAALAERTLSSRKEELAQSAGSTKSESAEESLARAFAATDLMPVYLSRTQAERNAKEQGKVVENVPIRYYSTLDEEKEKRTMELVFERAKEEDLEKIAAIEQVSFPDPWSEDSLWTFASDETIRTLVTAKNKESGELVGYYALQYVLDEAEIAIVAVAAKYRRQGVGRELIEAIKAFCKSKKISMIHLEVRAGNEAAVHLYRAMGFQETGCRKNYYDKPKEDALLFSLSI